jgi:hypothetical protein
MIRRQAVSPAEPLPDRSTSSSGATRASIGAEGTPKERVLDLQMQSSTSPDSTAKEGGVSGRLWDPLIGLSEREVEEWEQQGNFECLNSLRHTHHQFRESCGVA